MRSNLPTRFENYIDGRIRIFSEFSTEILFLTLLALCMIARIALFPAADPDLFTRLAIGRLIFLAKTVPLADPFAFTLTKPIWHDHELIPAVIFFFVWRLFQDQGIFLLSCFFCISTIFIVRRCQLVLSRADLSSYSLLFVCMLFSALVWLSVIRAQVFTYLFLACFLLAFSCYRRSGNSRALWFLPLLMIAWVNSHGGFVLGLGLFATFLAVLFWERKLSLFSPVLSFLACCAATLINPYGVSFLGFIAKAVTDTPDFVATNPPNVIPEWLPVSFSSPEFFATLFVLIIVVLGYFRRRETIPPEGIAFVLLTFFFGLRHYRFLPAFFIVTSSYGANAWRAAFEGLSQYLPNTWAVLRRCVFILFVLIVSASAVFVVRFLCFFDRFELPKDGYPREAMDWLLENYQGGKVLTHYNNGSYVLWRVWPRFKISLDGRFDGAFPVSTMDESLAASTPRNPRHFEALKHIDPDFVLLGPENESSHPEIEFPGYHLAYRSGIYAVLVKMGLPTQAPGKNREIIPSP